jgi:thiol-disulfide isomerase/thioredoxin
MRRLLLAVLLLLPACQKEATQPSAEQNAAAVASSVQAPAPGGKVDRSHAGKPAPDLEFDDPGGDTVSLASFGGKPVLVNLWATWCGPCVREMPTLDRLAATQGDKLQVIPISQDMDGREKVDIFFAKAKLKTIEPYMDPKLALMDALGTQVLPTTILFDAQGREVWRVVGDEDWQGARAAALIQEAFRTR